MIVRVILSIVVAIVVGVLVNLLGRVLLDVGVSSTGSYLDSVSVLLGIAAGVWYYFAGPYPARGA